MHLMTEQYYFDFFNRRKTGSVFCVKLLQLLQVVCLLLPVAFSSGCATGGDTSASLSKRLMFYPEAKYLTAEGIGQSEAEAKNIALSELSRIFEAKVLSETSDVMVSLYTDKDGKKSEVFTQQAQAKVRVTSGVAFEGVRTKETWFDKTDKKYHALAVLKRAEAGAAWLAKVNDLDNKIRAELLAIESVQSRFLLFRGYRRVEDLWVERAVYASRIRVIGGTVPVPDYNMSEVLAKMAQVRSEIAVFFELTGDNAEILQYEIVAALIKLGFKVAPDRESSSILISGQIKVHPLEMSNPGWQFAGAEAGVVLKDLTTGNEVGSVSKEARAAHLEFRGAVRRAVRKVAGEVSRELLLLFK